MSSVKLSMDWATFCKAFAESLDTEFYGDTYPQYEEECDNISNIDMLYIKKAIEEEGISPTEVLDKYLSTLIMCPRYGKEAVNPEIIKYLISNGASFSEELILSPNYKEEYVYRDYMLPGREMVKVSYDDEFMNYCVKGRILDDIQSIVPLPGVDAIDWTKVKAEYWEYLADDDSVDVDAPITDELRWRVLKSESKYLLEKFPCPGDNSESYPQYNNDDHEDE